MSADLVNIFTGTYRGVISDNYDPLIKGRCKIWIPSIYPKTLSARPEVLPWAEPVMPMFGGSYKNSREGDLNQEVGVTTIPHVGAEVWVFFENGDHNFPKYFAACQAGPGWLSEHNNQHVIKTDNVRIRIDENTDNVYSTSEFTSYNDKCTVDSIEEHTKEAMPTRVDIEILMKTGCGLNLKIRGDVNIFISGDVYEDIRGNKHETLSGDLFRHHIGNSHIVQEGNIHLEHIGSVLHDHRGDRSYIQYVGNETEMQLSGDRYNYQRGDKTLVQIGNNIDTQVQGGRTFTQLASETQPTPLYNETIVGGNLTEYISVSENMTILNSSTKVVGVTLSETAGAQATRTASVIIDKGSLIDHKSS